MIMKLIIAAAAIASGLSIIAPARANILTSYLTASDPTAGLTLPGTGHYGTITVTDHTGFVSVDVQLDSPYDFVNTSGPHTEFALNLDKAILASQVTSILPATFSVTVGSNSATPFGTYSVGLNCSTCRNGQVGAVPPPLDFDISGITTADFVGNTDSPDQISYIFAADLVNTSTGKTGSVAATTTSTTIITNSSVPEPASMALLLVGLTGVAAVRRAARSA
jgi:hypothetical protein